jgi:hypothetical protein
LQENTLSEVIAMKSVIGKSLALGLLVGAAAVAACSTHNPGQGGSTSTSGAGTVTPSNVDGTGTVGFQYTLPGGEQINTVTYTLTNGTNSYSASVNVADAGTISFVIGGVAAGAGYSIVLSATTVDGKNSCSGSVGVTLDGGLAGGPTFSVANRSTTTVNVQLVCYDLANLSQGSVLVNGFTNCCATWDTAIASPSGLLNNAPPGNTTTLSANASGPCASPDGGQLVNCTWTVVGTGSIGTTTTDGAGNFVATYTCATGANGTDTINLDCTDGPLPDGGSCPQWSTHYSQTVTCGTPPVCPVQGTVTGPATPNTAAGTCPAGSAPVGAADISGNFCCETPAAFCGAKPVAAPFSAAGTCTGGLVNDGTGCCVPCSPPGGDQTKCNAYVAANVNTNHNASGSTCTATEDVLFQVDGTGACLGCLFNAGCLDDTLGDSGQECEDTSAFSAHMGTEAECLAVVECGMAVPTNTCGVATANAPAKGSNLNAYCGAEATSTCTSTGPIGTCASQETSGFGGLSPANIVGNFGSRQYASGMANALFSCGHSNCVAQCGL